MSETTTADPKAPGTHAPFWEDIVDIYLAPRSVFERRRDASYVPALITITLAVTVLMVPFQLSMGDVMAAAMREALANSGAEIPTAQLEQMARVSLFTAPLGALVVTPIAALLTGLVIWGTAALFGARMTFKAGVLIATFAAFPRVWTMITSTLQATLLSPTGPHQVSLGPARFMDAAGSPVLVAALGRLDILVLWSAALVAVGVATVAGAPRGRAWAVAAVVWVVSSLPAIAGPLFMSMNR